MLARLGNVLYWFASGVSGLIWILGLVLTIGQFQYIGLSALWIMFWAAIASVLVFLVGLALRYILRGPK